MIALALLRRDLREPLSRGDRHAALGFTLLHNFLWHLHYTWRDRRGSSPLAQLLRFHLTNGLVSLTGNLLIVRLLAGRAHIPLLIANAVAVVWLRAVANFFLGNAWAFGASHRTEHRRKGMVGPPGLEPGTNGL